MKILIVEDLGIMRRVVANTLKAIGYDDVIEAPNAEHALKIIEDHNIELIITDWLMPGMDGLEFSKIIKNDERFSDIPIIMLTTKGHKEDVLEAIYAKIDAYIVKPFNAQILKEKIDSVISPYKTYNI